MKRLDIIGVKRVNWLINIKFRISSLNAFLDFKFVHGTPCNQFIIMFSIMRTQYIAKENKEFIIDLSIYSCANSSLFTDMFLIKASHPKLR